MNIPVLVDGDTGFGGIPNVVRLLRDLEKAGAAGVNIEDQELSGLYRSFNFYRMFSFVDQLFIFFMTAKATCCPSPGLLDNSGKTIDEAANDLGINKSVLVRWRGEERRGEERRGEERRG